GAPIVMERDIFAMARRGFEAALGPVLRVGRDGDERHGQERRERERQGVGKAGFHAQQCSGPEAAWERLSRRNVCERRGRGPRKMAGSGNPTRIPPPSADLQMQLSLLDSWPNPT